MKKNTRNIIFGAALAAVVVLLLVLIPRCVAINTPFPNQPASPSQPNGQDPSPSHTEAIDMEVSFIDVGQGDSILIMSEGYSLLVDAGDRHSGDEVVAYLREQGVVRIDYIVATHGDADHIGGMAEVLRVFDVNHDIIAPQLPGDSPTYNGFIAAVEQEPGVGLRTPAVGSSFELGDATVEVIANGDGETKTNNSSIVLRVLCGERSALLTGDIPSTVERRLVNSNVTLESDVLKVAHHGSKYSSSTVFLEAVRPTYAVISCGASNPYGHPAPETLERLRASGAEVLSTADDGNIVFLFSDGVITYKKAA